MARDFDGSNDYIDYGTTTNTSNIFDSGGSCFSWFNVDADGSSTTPRIFAKGPGSNGWQLFYDTGINGLIFQQLFATGFDSWQGSTNSITQDTLYSGGVTYDSDTAGNTATLYLNGSSASFSSASTGSGTRSDDSGSSLIIGNRSDAARPFDGLIAECALWSAQLTALNYATLNRGVNPFVVRNDILLYYSAIYGTDSPELESVTPISGTVSGTTKRAHPPVELLENYL